MGFIKEDALYLFCDASIVQLTGPGYDGRYLGCPGVIAVDFKDGTANILNIRSKLLYETTNNNSEINAVLLGIYEALNNRNRYNSIKLISDSLVCINGLTTWVYQWMQRCHNGILYSSSGEPVANQDIFLRILYLITYNNLNIELYHQKGHVANTVASYQRAREVFYKSNNILLDDTEIEVISYYNNMIDRYTKDQLNLVKNTNDLEIYKLTSPFFNDVYDCNMGLYKSLTKRRCL